MTKKYTINDIKKIRKKINELEDYIIELENMESYKRYKQVREIRSLQKDIENKLKMIGNNLEISSTQVQFNYESISNTYRLKKSKHQEQIKEALFEKNLAQKVKNTNSSSSVISTAKDNSVKDQENDYKVKSKDKLDKKIEKLLANVDIKGNKADQYKKKIRNKIESVKKNKKYKDYKIKLKVEKNSKNNHKINLRLVKKNGKSSS